MPERLTDTVALVTGGSSGIGEAAARRLAQHGAAVAVVARRRERLEQICGEIREMGGRALLIEGDLCDRAQAFAAVDRTIREWGRLDTVINNAGVMFLGRAEGAPIEEWERMVSVNVLGLLYVAHAALPHLLHAAKRPPRRVADLINVSSVAGRVARPASAVYSLTKFGVGAFSESLRQEVTARHVRVSLLEPGAVATELVSHMRAESQAEFEKRFKDIEQLQATDIADAIEFIVTRPRHVAINEIMIRPTDQFF